MRTRCSADPSGNPQLASVNVGSHPCCSARYGATPLRSPLLTSRRFPMRRLARLARSDEAIAVTEYGLLVALIAVLLIAVVAVFGSSISSWFAARTSQITTV